MIETAYQNKVMIRWMTIFSVAMGVLYMVNGIVSPSSTPLLVVIASSVFIPVIIGWSVYKKDSASVKLHYIMFYGYLVFYTGILLYTKSPMVYCYIIPILILSMIYEDGKLCLTLGGIAAVVNMIDIITELFIKHNITFNDAEVQALSIVSILLFMISSSKCIEYISKSRLKAISVAKDRTEEMLDKVETSAKVLANSVTEINSEAKEMAESGTNSEQAIEGIVAGTRELNEIVQNELEMSGVISDLLSTTLDIANGVSEEFTETMAVTNKGNEAVQKLGEAADIGKEAGEKVDDSMSELVKKVDEVVSILDAIQGITKKTSMLALNASIEAARAGEAGRGFAVVAEEIKDLSEETTQATTKINTILADLTACTHIAGENVSKLLETNSAQIEFVNETKYSFDEINKAITSVNKQISEQGTYINKVSSTNDEIKMQIETLSGFAEELLANTENTRATAERTIEGTRNISDYLGQVMNEVQNLNAIMQE